MGCASVELYEYANNAQCEFLIYFYGNFFLNTEITKISDTNKNNLLTETSQMTI